MKHAPKLLQTAGKSLWRSVLAVYELTPAELLLLERACRTADKLARLDGLMAETAALVRGSTNQFRPNPMWAMAADCERLLISQLAALALPAEEDQDAGSVEATAERWKSRRVGLVSWQGAD